MLGDCDKIKHFQNVLKATYSVLMSVSIGWTDNQSISSSMDYVKTTRVVHRNSTMTIISLHVILPFSQCKNLYTLTF